jgi:hypothetical protein
VNVSAFDAYRPPGLHMKESIWYWQNPQGHTNYIANPFCAQLPDNKETCTYFFAKNALHSQVTA